LPKRVIKSSGLKPNLKHGKVGFGEGSKVVWVNIPKQIECHDCEDSDDDCHDGEGVGY
jgi:hypothetical protein